MQHSQREPGTQRSLQTPLGQHTLFYTSKVTSRPHSVERQEDISGASRSLLFTFMFKRAHWPFQFSKEWLQSRYWTFSPQPNPSAEQWSTCLCSFPGARTPSRSSWNEIQTLKVNLMHILWKPSSALGLTSSKFVSSQWDDQVRDVPFIRHLTCYSKHNRAWNGITPMSLSHCGSSEDQTQAHRRKQGFLPLTSVNLSSSF